MKIICGIRSPQSAASASTKVAWPYKSELAPLSVYSGEKMTLPQAKWALSLWCENERRKGTGNIWTREKFALCQQCYFSLWKGVLHDRIVDPHLYLKRKSGVWRCWGTSNWILWNLSFLEACAKKTCLRNARTNEVRRRKKILKGFIENFQALWVMAYGWELSSVEQNTIQKWSWNWWFLNYLN